MKSALKYDNIIIGLGTVCFTASFLTGFGWISSYVMLACTVLMVCFSAVQSHGKLWLHIDAFHILTSMFIFYCFLSMLWAKDASMTFLVLKRIVLAVLLYYMQYTYYQKRPVDYVLMTAMLGGYAACIIVLWQQGFDLYLSNIVEGIRVYDQFINANEAGVMAAHAILLNLYFILYKRKIGWWTWLAIPALICVAGAGSKRSLLILVGGSFMLMLLHNYDRKKIVASALKGCAVILLLAATIYALGTLPMFAMITGRFKDFIGAITGTGSMDASTQTRLEYIQVGVYLFKKSPLIGCGINNPRVYNWIRDTYLHSNMMEMLAAGGVVGFGLYYSIHTYLFYNMWKYRSYRDDAYDILLVILLFYLICDISDMSYSQKDTYFYYMAMFLKVRELKRAARKGKPYVSKNRKEKQCIT